MPRKPKRPCHAHGCPNLVQPGQTYCAAHAHLRRTPDTRPGARQRGYDRTWQRIRTAVLDEERYCRSCMAAGRVALATVVDHIRPLRDGGTHARNNLQPLCESCHNAKSAAEGHARRRDAGGEGA